MGLVATLAVRSNLFGGGESFVLLAGFGGGSSLISGLLDVLSEGLSVGYAALCPELFNVMKLGLYLGGAGCCGGEIGLKRLLKRAICGSSGLHKLRELVSGFVCKTQGSASKNQCSWKEVPSSIHLKLPPWIQRTLLVLLIIQKNPSTASLRHS